MKKNHPKKKEEKVKGKFNEHLLFITVGKYKMFYANGSVGIEALLLLLFLYTDGIKKGSNIIWANNKYIMKGLHIGETKVKRAKTFLVDKKLISYEIQRDNKGRFVETYISLNQMWDIDQLLNWISEKGLSNYDQPQVQKLPLVVDSRLLDTKSNNSIEINEEYKIPKRLEDSNEKEKLVFFNELIKSSISDEGFEFSKLTEKVLHECFSLFGNDHLILIFQKYLNKKSPQQIRNFHSKDLPSLLRNEIKKKFDKNLSKSKKKDKCPICNLRVKSECGLNYCHICGLDINDFNNPKVIAETRSELEQAKVYA